MPTASCRPWQRRGCCRNGRGRQLFPVLHLDAQQYPRVIGRCWRRAPAGPGSWYGRPSRSVASAGPASISSVRVRRRIPSARSRAPVAGRAGASAGRATLTLRLRMFVTLTPAAPARPRYTRYPFDDPQAPLACPFELGWRKLPSSSPRLPPLPHRGWRRARRTSCWRRPCRGRHRPAMNPAMEPSGHAVKHATSVNGGARGRAWLWAHGVR